MFKNLTKTKMNKKEFSLKRVAFGVLIGVLSISTFVGIGRATQANMFSEMFVWLVSENCYYDSTGAYVCDDSTVDDSNCYDSTGAYVCDDSTVDDSNCYDSTGAYICDDSTGGDEGCYYDSTGAYTCDGEYDDTNSCYDSAGNYICSDQSDDGYEDGTQGCGDCDGRCVQVGETFSCEAWDYEEASSSDDYYDQEDNQDNNQDQWQQDPEQMQEDMENMSEMLENAAEEPEDINDAKEEATEWQEDLLDRAEKWQEDLDDMNEWAEEGEDIMIQPIYEEAIAYVQTAYDAIEMIKPEFDALLIESESTKAAMEAAYEDYVAAGTGDSSAFWDAQSNGTRDWMDIYRMEAEMWGRLVNFYDFLIESTRIETETGMTAEEIGGEFATAVATAEETISTIKSALEDGGELDSVIAAAEAEIAGGEDTWQVLDDVRDYFDDMRDLMEEEKDMWDSMENAWDLVKDKEMETFRTEEITMIREDLTWVTEKLDEMEAEGEDVSEARDIVEEIGVLLDQIEATTDSEMAEDLMKDLEKLGKKAEKELTNLGIEFGKYDTQAYVNSIDVNDPDALMSLLSQVPQNVLEQVIQMLLANVNSADIESFISYSEQYGDVGFFDSSAIAYMDADTLDAMIEDKLAILEGLDAEIASRTDELMALSEKIAGYNFYGDSVDQVVELQSNLYTEIEGASDEEVKDIVAEYDEQIEDLKDEAREEKYDADLIPFMDTDDDQWFTSYVTDVKNQNIVSGYKDENGEETGYFGPSDKVTGGEILKMSLESAGQGEGEGTPNNPYAQDSWSAGYFDKAEDLDMSIVEDMTQDPNDSATRGEVIQTLFESLGVTVPTDTDTTFQDVPEDYEYYDAIAYAQELGIINGDNGEGEIFRPEDSVNRAETAKMIDAFLETMALEGLVEY